MRVERLGHDKVRIFLTFDDLMERGIEKDDIWQDIPKVHELFNDMMEQAYNQVGFEIDGPVAVEVFALPAQGMVVIVTRGNKDRYAHLEDDLAEEEDVYEMQVTLEENDWILYRFQDFEDLVSALRHGDELLQEGGKVYAYDNQYYLYLTEEEIDESCYHDLISVLSEYGEASTATPYWLEEYGKLIMDGNAVQIIHQYFFATKP